MNKIAKNAEVAKKNYDFYAFLGARGVLGGSIC
jgi:hypothetical protein